MLMEILDFIHAWGDLPVPITLGGLGTISENRLTWGDFQHPLKLCYERSEHRERNEHKRSEYYERRVFLQLWGLGSKSKAPDFFFRVNMSHFELFWGEIQGERTPFECTVVELKIPPFISLFF